MVFERYMIRANNRCPVENITRVNINDEVFQTYTIDGYEYEFFTNPIEHEFQNASFDNLITLFTKPQLVFQENGLDLYKTKLAYVKTKDGQLIVNVNDMNIVNHLDRYQGLLDFIDVFFLVYSDKIKFSVQYKYQSISQSVLFIALRNIINNGFLREQIDQERHLELLRDYLATDFEATFNASRKNKKLTLYLDTINNGIESVNSIKYEYSLKANITFENAFSYVQENMNDNVLRYTIKCEDDFQKTATIEGTSENLFTEDWTKPARITISTDNLNNLGLLTHVHNFLSE